MALSFVPPSWYVTEVRFLVASPNNYLISRAVIVPISSNFAFEEKNITRVRRTTIEHLKVPEMALNNPFPLHQNARNRREKNKTSSPVADVSTVSSVGGGDSSSHFLQDTLRIASFTVH